jgi:hypothetical protein
MIVHPRSNGPELSSLFSWCQREQSALGAMATSGEGAQACVMGHGARESIYLSDLEEQGVSFYSLLVKQMIHGGLAAVA